MDMTGQLRKRFKRFYENFRNKFGVLDSAGAAQIEALMKDCIIAPASLGGYDGMTILDTMSRTNDIFTTMNGIFSANTLLLYEMKPGGQQFTTVIPDLTIDNKYLKRFFSYI